jgi:hypothetical protein
MRHIDFRPLALAAALFLVPPGASAKSIVWTLHDVTMSGGTSLNGNFTIDSTTGDLTAWDITMNGGPFGTGSGYLFSNTLANFVVDDGPQTYEIENGGPSFIELNFVSALPADGAQVNINGSEFFCVPCGVYEVSGESGFAAAPEPAAWALAMLGVAGVGGTFRRLRRESAIAG